MVAGDIIAGISTIHERGSLLRGLCDCSGARNSNRPPTAIPSGRENRPWNAKTRHGWGLGGDPPEPSAPAAEYFLAF
jgi:hypothetical protein